MTKFLLCSAFFVLCARSHRVHTMDGLSLAASSILGDFAIIAKEEPTQPPVPRNPDQLVKDVAFFACSVAQLREQVTCMQQQLDDKLTNLNDRLSVLERMQKANLTLMVKQEVAKSAGETLAALSEKTVEMTLVQAEHNEQLLKLRNIYERQPLGKMRPVDKSHILQRIGMLESQMTGVLAERDIRVSTQTEQAKEIAILKDVVIGLGGNLDDSVLSTPYQKETAPCSPHTATQQ